MALVLVLVAYNAIIYFDGGIKRIDSSKTLVHCSDQEKEVLTAKDLGLTFSASDFRNGFDYKEFFEGYNDYSIRTIFINCYEMEDAENVDVFALQRVYELKKGRDELPEEERGYVNSQIETITSGFKTVDDKMSYLDFSSKGFDIKPAYSYSEFLLLFVIGNLAILLVFELIRRAFYYILLGRISPLKK